jgi:hypothetical protein
MTINNECEDAIASVIGNRVATNAQMQHRPVTRSQTRADAETGLALVDILRSGHMGMGSRSKRSVLPTRRNVVPVPSDANTLASSLLPVADYKRSSVTIADDDNNDIVINSVSRQPKNNRLKPHELDLRIRSRPSTQSARSIRERAKRPRFNWNPTRKQLQHLYDLELPRNRILKKLWRIASIVRSQLERGDDANDSADVHNDQSALNRGTGSLSSSTANGVIYAVYCLRSKHIYVGQTINSSQKRFEEHINNALRGENEPFYRAIRRFGWRNFGIFPLEVIPKSQYAHIQNKRLRLNEFRRISLSREQFWIHRLHSYQPKGWNAQHTVRFARRRRLARKRVLNPMKHLRLENQTLWNRILGRRIGVVGSTTGKGLNYKRWFGSREWHRRLEYLFRSIQAGRFHDIKWNLYSFRTLKGILRYLESIDKECNQNNNINFDNININIFSEENRKLILSTLRENILIRPDSKSKPDRIKKGRDFIRIEWNSDLLHRCGLKSIILDHEVKQLFPGHLGVTLEDIIIVKKLKKSIGTDIFNFSKVSRQLPNVGNRLVGGDIDACDCPCRKLFGLSFRPSNGCVRTGDVSIVKHAGLRQLICYGPRFRERPNSSACDPIASLSNGIQDYIDYHVSRGNCNRRHFEEWKRVVIARCALKLGINSERNSNTSQLPLLHQPHVRKYLRYLHRHLVLVPMDKASNNVAFICKSLYVNTLRNELHNNGSAYQTYSKGVNDILADHKLFYRELFGSRDMMMTSSSSSSLTNHHSRDQPIIHEKNNIIGQLPYLYGMPKFHKSGWRFIAGSGTCSTTRLSKLISSILHELLFNSLRNKDNNFIRQTGIRRFFIVESNDEVSSFLGRWRRTTKSQPIIDATLNAKDDEENSQCIYTGDFSTMYTTIPHHALINALESCIDEALQWECEKRDFDSVNNIRITWSSMQSSDVNNSHCSFSNGNRSRQSNAPMASKKVNNDDFVFTKESLLKCIRFLVDNIFVVNGNCVRRQVVGIPMGTNCAPVMANMFLYYYESRFIDRITINRGPDIARLFHMTFRLIDDTLSIDNPLWIEYAFSKNENEGGIYPSELQLNDTTPATASPVSNNCSVRNGPVHFLGMNIAGMPESNRFHIWVFDKRDEFAFPVRRYPHMESLIPRSIPYAVFMGQLHRGYRICTLANDFLDFSCGVAQRLIDNGCSKVRLLQLFIGFIKRFVVKYQSMGLRYFVNGFRQRV